MSFRARAASAVPNFRAFEVPLVLAHLECYFAFLIVAHLRGYLIVFTGVLFFDILYIDFLVWPSLARFSVFSTRAFEVPRSSLDTGGPPQN